MITSKKICNEIDKLLCGQMSWDNLKKLDILLDVHHRLKKYAAYGEEEMGMEDEHAEKKVAIERVNHMVNVDGSHGAHWPMEQTSAILEQRGYSCDPAEFYVVMNMMYSDYHNVFKRYGVESPDFYAEMSKAWIDDPDAKKDKTAEYFCHVVKH